MNFPLSPASSHFILALFLSIFVIINEYEWNCLPWRMLTTPVKTQDRPLPLGNNCFNPTPSHRPFICY